MSAVIYNQSPQFVGGNIPQLSRRTRTVLVIDDEESLLTMVQEILEDEGFHVLTAHEGRKGLSIAVRSQPDIIITDLMMPHMNGRVFCNHLYNDPRTASIPVILMSAVYQPHSDDQFAAVVTKPFQIDELIDSIDKLSSPLSSSASR